jgi:hypothetical protein
MPITEFLDGYRFDSETRRVMGFAYEMACAALKFENRTYLAHEIIATRIIALVKDGLVDPDRLCEQALNDLHNPPPMTDRSPAPAPPRERGQGNHDVRPVQRARGAT